MPTMKKTLKLYLWQNGGVSAAYHDDGLIVMLAESEREARDIHAGEAQRLRGIQETALRARQASYEAWRRAYFAEHAEREIDGVWRWRPRRREKWMSDAYWEEVQTWPRSPDWECWMDLCPEAKALSEMAEATQAPPDFDELPERPADFVFDLDAPRIVAFNGGGYD